MAFSKALSTFILILCGSQYIPNCYSYQYQWLDVTLLNQCDRCLSNWGTTFWVRPASNEDSIQPGICLLRKEILKMKDREVNGTYFCHPFDCLDPYEAGTYKLHQLLCTGGN
jgi:hypothetical protein